ncbi:uncharacterized protein LOC129958955 [Argiope bruennichi]|nr:uncharacterized protein LOC129958955 [Argiope bruennichi]XP_055927686.1 uncharacterized protein LOC129958955 [Argiope bruennichi]KAF8785892.1 Ninjurin-2 like protein [Argiope bruennichi]
MIVRQHSIGGIGTQEEMKDLFKEHEDESENGKCGNNSKRVNLVEEMKPAEPRVQVRDSAAKTAGNHLITRRITIAGGFLDIALFTTNCEQMKFVLELGEYHIYYRQVLGLLITSLILQLLVGLTMFLLGCHVVNKYSSETYSNVLNHATMGLVALITITNIFISTFGPKGDATIGRCLATYALSNPSGPVLMSNLNATKNYNISSF